MEAREKIVRPREEAQAIIDEIKELANSIGMNFKEDQTKIDHFIGFEPVVPQVKEK